MLPSGPSQIIQRSKFTYSPLGKVLKKKLFEDKKGNYVDVGLYTIFGNQTILKIESKMKILVASTEN